MSGTARPARLEVLLAQRTWVRRLARALVLDESRADDLEQEAWLGAIRTAEPRFPRAWLATVLRRGASRMRRGERRRTLHEAAAPPTLPPPAPEEIVARAEAVDRVAAAVRTLEEPYRTAIFLRYFEDLSPPAIAARLQVPLETVRTRLRRALGLLRRRLDGGAAGWLAALASLGGAPDDAVSSGPVGGAAGAALGGALLTKGAAGAVLGLILLAGVLLFPLLRDRPGPGDSRDSPREVVRASSPAAPDAESLAGVPPPVGSPTGNASASAEPPRQASAPSDGHARILELLSRLNGDPVVAVNVSRELQSMDPDLVAEVLRERWGSIGSTKDRIRILDWPAGRGNPRIADLLDLQYRDPDSEVHATGARYLRGLSGVNFQGDLPAYERWRTRVAGKPVSEVLLETTNHLADRMATTAPGEWPSLLETIHMHLAARRSDMTGAEVLLPGLETWFREKWAFDPNDNRTQHLLSVVIALRPDEPFLRRTVVPFLESDRPDAWLAGMCLASMKCRWAVDLFVARLEAQVRSGDAHDSGPDPVYMTAQFLGVIGDLRAFRPMLALLREVEGTDRGPVLSKALCRLTGVPWGKEVDAAWWERWSKDNTDLLRSAEGDKPGR